jgi:hypothetical protein
MGRAADVLAGAIPGAALGAILGALAMGARAPLGARPDPVTGRAAAPAPSPRTAGPRAVAFSPAGREARPPRTREKDASGGAGERPAPSALSALVAEIESPDPARRSAALDEARAAHRALSRALRARLCAESDPEIRAEAVEAVAEAFEEGAISDLAAVLEKDESSEVREAAAAELAGFLDDSAFSPLARALVEDPDPAVRKAAAAGLSLLATPAAIEALTLAADSDPDPDARLAIAEERDWAAAIARGDADPRPEAQRFREAVLEGLGRAFGGGGSRPARRPEGNAALPP